MRTHVQTVLDLQATFARCHDRCNLTIDYQREPSAPLSAEDRRWIDEVLRLQKLRDKTAVFPSEEQIAATAYLLWQQERCPHGRDKEHWQAAIAQLQRAGEQLQRADALSQLESGR
jgi:hypothetical protein